MTVIRLDRPEEEALDVSSLDREATDADYTLLEELISVTLTDDQVARVVTPPQVYPRQESVLAIHWHPEFVPVDLIRQRIDASFPSAEQRLIIPTQHNMLESFDGFTGVEVDCFHAGFRRKIQLLVHFSDQRLEGRGEVFRAMLAHTFKYREGQLWEFFDTLIEPRWQERIELAADETGASRDLVEFVRVHSARLAQMIRAEERRIPPTIMRNKIIRDYFDQLRTRFDDRLINHAQVFLRHVKEVVKSHFSPHFFYRAQEFIEEIRALGGGIVIPHPEQFWPILLADLDVDGIEVWNPQSFEFTDFLVHVVMRENKTRRHADRPLIVTMGDDCHMGEKVKDKRFQDPAKASREIGVQPPWDDLTIRKTLIVANASRENVIREYRDRII